jgi:competence protein ComEA
MNSDKLSGFWLIITGILVLIIIISAIIIWSRSDRGQSIDIRPPPTSQFQGAVYVDGAVGNPGRYPLKADDSIEGILHSSGGLEKNANISQMYLYVPPAEKSTLSQKIDINRAEPWLLQALPGIGEVRAQAIYDFRQQNGLFSNIEEITKVPGINNSTFEKIKDLITIAEYR